MLVNGACYMKSTLGPYLTAGAVWTAKEKTVTLTCDNGKDNGTVYTSPSGKSYLVICGWEYGGGDLAATNTASFEACMNTCATTTGCIDVSYGN